MKRTTQEISLMDQIKKILEEVRGDLRCFFSNIAEPLIAAFFCISWGQNLVDGKVILLVR
jgi:hypothetical protein